MHTYKPTFRVSCEEIRGRVVMQALTETAGFDRWLLSCKVLLLLLPELTFKGSSTKRLLRCALTHFVGLEYIHRCIMATDEAVSTSFWCMATDEAVSTSFWCMASRRGLGLAGLA